jgi:hypothetical protein
MEDIYTTKQGISIDLSIIQIIAKIETKILGKEQKLTKVSITVENKEKPIIIELDSTLFETVDSVIEESIEMYDKLILAWREYKLDGRKGAVDLYITMNK